ncbi:MAG: amidohydrolase family protein [Candidatus Parvarchaeota archaeon]
MMKNIDVHSHMLPAESIRELSGEILSIGKDLYNIKVNGKSIKPMTKGFFDIDARKKELSEMGVDGQIISPTHHLFFYSTKLDIVERTSRIQNNRISEVCKKEPDRFFGNATLPMQDPKAAVSEMERAYSELEMKGIEIGTNIGGKNLDDQSLYPVYERAQELEMPIFVHPNDFLAPERLEKYYMGIVVGTLAETTIAVTSVLFGGVFSTFPKLKMIFCHGGGALPYQVGRLKQAVSIRDELKGANVDIDKSLKTNVFFDTVVFDDPSLAFLVERTGSENVLLGTDYPFNMGNWKSAKQVEKNHSISDSARKQILVENAKKLYKL